MEEAVALQTFLKDLVGTDLQVIPMVMVAAVNLPVIQMVFHGILMGVMGAVVLPACLMVDLVEAIRLESMGVNRGGRALLDGGATHILRPPANELELSESVPIKVELAAGEAVLHQVKDTGTLLAENVETQVIIPLGKLAAIGYKVKWDERGFELVSPEGDLIDVELEAGCPTVDAETAQGLIEILEKVESEISLRVKALAAGDQMGLSSQVWRWMEDFKNRYPQVPNELVARIIPSGKWQ
eukprot:s2805_g1.t1